MRYLVLDFETKDPYLSKKLSLGPGWVFKVHNSNAMFKVLGFSYYFIDQHGFSQTKAEYCRCPEIGTGHLESVLNGADAVIMHNAQYDLGCLRALNIDIKNIQVLDTKIIAKLYDNRLMSYSLDPLSKKYLPTEQQKKKGSLVDVIKKHSLAPTIKEPKRTKKDTDESYAKRVANWDKRLTKWAYENMDLIQEADFNTMAYYATQDVIATANLFMHFSKRVPLEQALYFSKFQKICTVMREKGIKVDMAAIQKGIEKLEPEIEQLKKKIFMGAKKEFDILSPKQLSSVLLDLGYKLPKTEKGNSSSNKAWLDKHEDDAFCNLILKYRTAHKIYHDYFIKPRDMQMYTCPEAYAGAPYGRVFPEMNVLAAETGRFSSANPNIQQIPKRNKEYGHMCRAIFVPDDPNKKWYSLDWSNQEGRLQLHYAALIRAPKVKPLLEAFHDNPHLDMHGKVALVAGLCCENNCGKFDSCAKCKQGRSQAKTINLGLSYGMGEAKLCLSLGLPTQTKKIKRHGRDVVITCAGAQAQLLLETYYRMMPYLKYLNEKCTDRLKNNNHILTLSGRTLRREDAINGHNFDYKALNKLIQGSAADQCLAALNAAYDAGINIKCIVHDEFNIEGSEEDAIEMQKIMETIIPLQVPMVAEIQVGPSWGQLEKL